VGEEVIVDIKRKICNILFRGEIPLEVMLYSVLANCRKQCKLSMPVKAKIYYEPSCIACRKLFIYVMNTDNLEVEAIPVSTEEGKKRVLELVGEIVTPIMEFENGTFMRGCPIKYEDFIKCVEMKIQNLNST